MEAEFSLCFSYTDVEMDLEPILSGYRLELVYRLLQLPSSALAKPSASLLTGQIESFQSLLSKWIASPGLDSDFLIYILYEQYDLHGSLKFGLENMDAEYQHKAKYLQEQCQKKKISVYLSTLKISIDENLDESDASKLNFELHDITDLAGHMIAKEGPIVCKKNLLHPEYWEQEHGDGNDSEFERDEDDFEEYYEDEEANTRHFKDWVCSFHCNFLLCCSVMSFAADLRLHLPSCHPERSPVP